MGKYLEINCDELKWFSDKMKMAGNGDFKKEIQTYLDDIGKEFLQVIADEIIRLQAVDTGLLLNSFTMDSNDYKLNVGNLTLEVGTNVEYAKFVNDGHFLNPNGVETRFVPGYFEGNKFTYSKNSNAGIMLKQKWVDGKPYYDNALKTIEIMLPNLLEYKVLKWLENYF